MGDPYKIEPARSIEIIMERSSRAYTVYGGDMVSPNTIIGDVKFLLSNYLNNPKREICDECKNEFSTDRLYRCFHCKGWICQACGGKHFGEESNKV